jgi:hypothetical protein
MTEPHLTERQEKWFASVRAGIERDTGRTLTEWEEIAKTCPESGHRARLKWFKETHGLLQNRASLVLNEISASTMPWSAPSDLIEALWTDPAARAIYDALDVKAMALAGAIRTPRKGYTAWARRFQFAAARPLRGGGVSLGLGVPLEMDCRLEPRGNPSWSERLPARLTLSQAADVDEDVARLLKAAWEGA